MSPIQLRIFHDFVKISNTVVREQKLEMTLCKRQFHVLLFNAVDFDAPEVMCARSSFCYLQPDILCPTHKMALIEGCPLGTVLPLNPF